MTDLLSDVDDLLSSHEVIPKATVTSEPGALDKIRERIADRGKPKEPAKKVPAKKVPAPKKPSAPVARRRPLGESIARVVLQAGRLVNTLVDPPTGAAIMFEAGALGVAIDRAIAGTVIDKPLQKGAAVAERFEPLVPLITMPAMIFMLSHNPSLEPVIEGELREALEDVLVQSLPLLRRRAERTEQTVNALAEMKKIDPSLADSDDPIAEILRSFFAHPAMPQETVNDGDTRPD